MQVVDEALGAMPAKEANKLAASLVDALSQIRNSATTLHSIKLTQADLERATEYGKLSTLLDMRKAFAEYTRCERVSPSSCSLGPEMSLHRPSLTALAFPAPHTLCHRPGHTIDPFLHLANPRRLCRESNGADFDDLLGLTVALLQRVPGPRAELQRQWRHVMVDEFQDTNSSQYELVRLLRGPDPASCSTFVVGDPDQAIYGWRGANPANMEDAFESDFKDCATVYLNCNYRC